MADDIPRIPPQRSRAAMSTWLRELADAVDKGEVQYVFYGALNTPEAAREYGNAFRQAQGYVGAPEAAERFFWMVPLGMARSIYRDVEEQLLDIGAGTVGAIDTIKV